MTPRTAVLARRWPASPWTATLAATAISTYALDATASAAGAALAASGLLNELGHVVLLGFLAATYVVWAVGLRAGLRANWSLLRRTGASTNALSKGAFDLARRRGLRAQRAAAAAGYVITELAKEAPYYFGAFGAVLVTSSVSADDALVFLGGANLGAAAYEYGLARVTLALLRRRTCASFDADWIPGDYLADYYSAVEPDERETIAFFVEAIRRAPAGQPVLVLGTGPTLHHVFLAAERASELHLADYLDVNLEEIERWRVGDPGAHDWREFVRYTLQCEGDAEPTNEACARREDVTRAKITRLLQVDARNPIEVEHDYATVISAYCADSATSDPGVWETLMANITAVVRPGGLFLTAALRRCDAYRVGGRRFPSANIDEHDLARVLDPGFRSTLEVRDLDGSDTHGYSGIVLGRATAIPGRAADAPAPERARLFDRQSV